MREDGEEKRAAIKPKAHNITLENRQRAALTGVTDVESFNEQEVILRTEGGEISLVGEGLHIAQLNLEDGRLVIEGDIVGIEYGDTPQQRKTGLFRRMFR